MKYTEIADQTVAELKKKKKTLANDLFQSKMKNNLGQLANPITIRDLRKDIARVNTALSQKTVR
jgi:large subunit ribosomal protein L29